MIQADYYLKYFPNGVDTPPTLIAAQLALDLNDRVEEIYSKISPTQPPSSVLLQPTKNSLRHSAREIHLKNKPIFEDDGQCAGACKWLIALFLNLKSKHPEIPTHQLLTQASQEFVEGVGIQGALLQKYDHEEILHSLNLNRGKKTEIDLKDKDSSQAILETILELHDGVYILSFSGCPADECFGWGKVDAIPGHATAIFIENKNYYFFDPNGGLLGTGLTIGSENKIKDVSLLLRICNQYSPYERADTLFKQGIEKLSTLFNQEEAQLFQEVALQHRTKGRANLGSYEVQGIYDGFTKKGCVFSPEDWDNMFCDLCVGPGILQLRLESAEALRLYEYTYKSPCLEPS